MEKYFKRLNTLLLFFVVIFAGFFIFTNFKAQSGSQFFTDMNIDRSGNVTVVDKRYRLSFLDTNGGKFSTFRVAYLSDGINGSSGGDLEEMKTKGPPPIEIPLEFSIPEGGSYIDTPGTPLYKEVKKITAASSKQCSDTSANATYSSSDCLKNAISTAIWENGIRLETVSENGTEVFNGVDLTTDTQNNRWSVLLGSLSNLSNVRLIFTDANTPDRARNSLGSQSYWADDELQQIARVNGKLVYDVTTKVDKIEVTRAVEYSVQQFAASLPNNITKRIGFSNLFPRANGAGLGVLPYYDPKSKDEITEQNLDVLSGLLATIFPRQDQENDRLGVHIPLRKVEEADTYGAAYDFCAATASTDEGNKFWGPNTSFDNDDLPNPFERKKKEEKYKVPVGIDGLGNIIFDERTREVDDDEDDQSIFDGEAPAYVGNVGGDQRKCLSAVLAYQGETAAQSCAESLVASRGKYACDEFTIEEEDLNFSQIENPRDIAVSLGAYLRNAVFQDLNTNRDGPFINYLAPSFCAKMVVRYNISSGKSYIYRAGGGPGGNISTYDNQYCVVGAVLSNYSWVMTEQDDYFSSDNLAGRINQYKESLTCDKKEVANFGASFVETDNPTPDGENLVYAVRDNYAFHAGGYGRIDPESIMLYQGSNPIPIGDIISEINYCDGYDQNNNGKCIVKANYCAVTNPDGSCQKFNRPISIKQYGDHDIRVVSGSDSKPKYTVFITQNLSEADKESTEPRRLMVCTLEFAFGGTPKSPDTNLCAEIERSDKIQFVGDVVLTQYTDSNGSIQDVLTYAYKTDEKSPKLRVKFININKTNISKTTATPESQDMILNENEFWSIQMSSLSKRGQVAILTFNGDYSSSTSGIDLRLYTVDPIGKKLLFRNDLCLQDNGTCRYIKSQNQKLSVKMNYNYDVDKLLIVGVGGNIGLVYVPNPNGEAVKRPKIFTYNKNGKINAVGAERESQEQIEARKEALRKEILSDPTKAAEFGGDIEAAVLDRLAQLGQEEENIELNSFNYDAKSQTLYAFISSKISSYMLRIVDPEVAGMADAAYNLCGAQLMDQCLLTQQKEFNPSTFVWDCSDYYGTGSCGSKPMEPIGFPKVLHSVIKPNGKIFAWYTYTNMQNHVIFFSKDYEYSLNGVYQRVKGPQETTDVEYTNVFVPKLKDAGVLQAEGGKLGFFWDIAVSVPPVFGVRLYETVHLDVISYNNIYIVTEKLDVMRKDKVKCLDALETLVTDNDLFYEIPGIEKPFFADTEYVQDPNNPGSNDGDNTSFNPSGKYCEESWCVPDSFKLTNNPDFILQKNGGNMTDENFAKMKQQVASFLDSRRANDAPYGEAVEGFGGKSYVDLVCNAAEGVGMPCQIMIGIWIQESGAGRGDGTSSFNCFLKGADGIQAQIACAVNSLKNGAERYDGVRTGGKVLTGPGSIFTPNANKTDKNGSCETATRFSMMFQRYTPIDKNINYNNQCNRGLVIRLDNDYTRNDSQNLCQNDAFAKGADATDARNDDHITDAKWPSGELTGNGTRPNMRFGVEEVNRFLQTAGLPGTLQVPVSNQCYKADAVSNPDVSANEDEYEPTTQQSSITMDFSRWNKNAEAGYAQMAIDQFLSGGEYGFKNENPVPARRVMAISKSQGKFSYIAATGSLNEDKIPALKPFYAKRNYNFGVGSALSGAGLCELATGFRAVANRLQDNDGNFVFKESFPAYFAGPNSEGYIRHRYGSPIEHNEHSNSGIASLPDNIYTPRTFNGLLVGDSIVKYSLLPRQVLTGDPQTLDRTKFVAIWVETGAEQDLVINHTRGDDEYLMIKMERSFSSEQQITITMYYAKKKSTASNGTNTKNISRTESSMTTAISDDRRKAVLDRQRLLV